MKVPEGLEDIWMCLELVADRRATWTEITSVMSVDDVDMLRRAVGAIADAENEALREMRKESERAAERARGGR